MTQRWHTGMFGLPPVNSSINDHPLHRDVNAYSKQKNTLEPLRLYRGHSAVVEVSKQRNPMLTRADTIYAGCRLARNGREHVCFCRR